MSYSRREKTGRSHGRGLSHARVTEGGTIRDGVTAYALDPDRAKALWAKSEKWVDETF